ncbi:MULTISPECIES: efflux RND transporter periplasmic adaptor subunit [Thiorhodovibrio]|uniref:efflux RND transporter periplasmic adaptor subunit n=1 Tax=Thiorhodovibrio TaxID=61593 RepID=UPI001911F864|nr:MULTISPECIES: efflux RND transporter periplasmic adaptor subunit [Thiorhodovibrio]MBK5969522.1 efflux transporter periplasmic adaptor subunit [Thiorhodovibrio winogradskyi]WPL14279.1 Efflux pump periplasmic linker BepF [Thiorhodovibrio litoralis]
MRIVKTIFHGVGVLTLTVLAGVAIAGDDESGAKTTGADTTSVDAQAAELETAPVSYHEVEREYRLDGVVEAVNRTTVSAQTQGLVEEIFYDVDDFVERGSVIAQLRDTEHRARVAQAAAEMKAAVAQLEQAREEHRRVKGLYQKKTASDSEMDKAAAELKSAEAGLEATQAALEQAQEQLAYTLIKAPYSGIVNERFVEVGEMVSPGKPVMTGVSLEKLRVSVDVPQSVIPAVREQGTVRVFAPDGKPVETGALTVFPFAEAGSNSFEVRVALAGDHPGLFPGMFVKTVFVTGEDTELTIPVEAVVYRSEVTGTYVVDDKGRIGFRLIRVGRRLNGSLRVLSGLTEGEQVALDPIAAGVALKEQSAARAAGRSQDHG